MHALIYTLIPKVFLMNDIDNFFGKIANLPMMPKVIQEVITLLEHDDVNANDVVKKISLDQVLSAKVLRLSNSSYYGRSGSVKTLNDAIAITGLQNLKTLVVASGITAAFSKIEGIDIQSFWRHSFITANIARQLSRQCRYNTEVTYLSALMHNIGLLPIYMVYPTEASDLDIRSQNLTMKERNTVEELQFGINHCDIGAELTRRWNFPEEIQKTIQHYADPLAEKANKLASVVHLANQISQDLQADIEPEASAEALNTEVLAAINIDIDDLPENIESYKAFIAEAEAAL
jgi:HD-like signal output (HDOD) protein